MTPDEVARRLDRLTDVNRDAVHLARFVSFAALVEPALLRAARYAFVPHADAGAEADVWFSGLVQARSPHGIVFFAEIADSLRRGLTSPDAKAAFDLTSRLHAARARALRIEEEVNFLSLDPEANRARIEALLASAAAALVNGARTEVANWAGRAVPRFPPAVRQFEAATMLAVASDLRLGRGSILRAHFQGQDAIPSWLAQVAPSMTTVELGVHVTDAGITFGPATADTPILRAPATHPIMLELGWDERDGPHSRLVFVEPGERTAAERVPAVTVRVTTLAGQVYTLTASPGATPVVSENAVTLRAYPGAYRVLLKWFMPRPMPQCIGFAIERRSRDGRVETLSRFDRFAAGTPTPRSMAVAPLQAFMWSDEGDRKDVWPAQYRVVPVAGARAGPVPLTAQASAWSERVQPGPDTSAPVSAYFNRGLAFWGIGPVFSDRTIKVGERWPDEIEKVDRVARDYLGGSLLTGLIAILEGARTQSGEVYAAISELTDPEVIAAFVKFGGRAHVLVPLWRSRRERAVNEETVRILHRERVDVIADERPANRPSNNKFLVVCDAQGRPSGVWTGNAAWTPASLARQNLALYVRDRKLAAAYLLYWRRLGRLARHRGSRRELVAENVGPFVSRTSGRELRAWFTPTPDGSDLDFLRETINTARDGVVFAISDLSVYDDVLYHLEMAKERGVHVCGIVSYGMNVEIFRDGRRTRISAVSARLSSPEAIAALRQLTRGPMRPPQIRAIVVDPFGGRPVVIAGSTGFGSRAARTNDANLVMARGERALAAQCAATIEQIVADLDRQATLKRVRAGVIGDRDDDTWQQPYYSSPGRRRAMEFWTGIKTDAVPPRSKSAVPAKPPVKKRKTARKTVSAKHARRSQIKRKR